MNAKLEGQWHQIEDARAALHVATSMIVLQDFLPRQAARDMANTLYEEESRIRGNRSMNSKPTWDDARAVLIATMKSCLLMLEIDAQERRNS